MYAVWYVYTHRCEQSGGWENVLEAETCRTQQKININLENCAYP